jgi:hypothetical protein
MYHSARPELRIGIRHCCTCSMIYVYSELFWPAFCGDLQIPSVFLDRNQTSCAVLLVLPYALPKDGDVMEWTFFGNLCWK